jgi:hypothetical protein
MSKPHGVGFALAWRSMNQPHWFIQQCRPIYK